MLGEENFMNKLEDKVNQILKRSKVCGIGSDEVILAKNLVLNKLKEPELFICEGLWAAEKLIEKNIEIKLVLFNGEKLNQETEENLQKLLKLSEKSASFCQISEKSCKKISDRDGFDDYFIVAKKQPLSLENLNKILENKGALGIVMDGLEQPGNVGAILRSFDAAGGNFAIIVNKKAKLNNSRLVRASLGASFMLPVVETGISEAQAWLENNKFKCIVTDLSAKKSFKEADYSGKIAIIVGNEHTGISSSWKKLKNAERVIIPMFGSCESLNVGFAATLVAYEAGLQKFNKEK